MAQFIKSVQKILSNIYLFFISGFILISLFNYNILSNEDNIMGPVGAYISSLVISFNGVGAFSIPIILGILGYFYFTDKEN